MKIDKGHQVYIQNLNLNKEKDENKTKEKDPIQKTENKNVNIEISKAARDLAEKIRQGDSKVFSKRVEDIRKAILNDSYIISPDYIADKILANIKLQEEGKIDE